MVVLHFLTPWMPAAAVERLHLNSEASLPAWYSSSLLLAVSVAAAWAAWCMGPAQSKPWWVLAAGYLFLSADETSRLHELIDLLTPLKWVLIYGPCALLFAGCLAWSLRNEELRIRVWVLGGMLVFGIGGLGCEALSAWMYPLSERWQQVEYAAEEALEMSGTIMVLTGITSKIALLHPIDNDRGWGAARPVDGIKQPQNDRPSYQREDLP